MTPDKEAILMNYSYIILENVERYYRRKDVLEAMESYSASLLKENENLKQDAAKMYSSLMSKNFELQKENEELTRAFENNKEQLMELATYAKDLGSTIEEKEKEIERLKELAISLWYPAGGYFEEELQQFKAENNL